MDHNSYRYAEPISSVTIDPVPREQWLDTVGGRVISILAVIATFATVGGFDYADQLAAEAKAKQERAARIAAYADWHRQQEPPLSHPLPYDATVRQSGDGIQQPVTHHYFSKHSK